VRARRPIRVKPARSCPGRIRGDPDGERPLMELSVTGSQAVRSRRCSGRRRNGEIVPRRRRRSGGAAPATGGPSARAHRGVCDRSGRHANPNRSRPGAARMTSPHASPNGNTPLRAKFAMPAPKAGPVTRLTTWVVDVAIPKVIPDGRIAPLRRRLRRVDDRLERTARRLARHSDGRGR
jgi:hypothetical protein